jgi:hypothetical protein
MKGQNETRGQLKCRESNLRKLLEYINAGLDILSILLQLHVQWFRIFLEVYLSCQNIPQYPLDLLTYSKLQSMRTGEHCVLVGKYTKWKRRKQAGKFSVQTKSNAVSSRSAAVTTSLCFSSNFFLRSVCISASFHQPESLNPEYKIVKKPK